MSSNNIVDEFVVSVKVDADDYEKGIDKLTESNDKLQDKLAQTEQATQKVSESAGKLGESFNETGGKTEELSEKNEKLNEGLEDTEKQMQKTSKSTRENARDIKNTTDEFQKLSTGIGTTLSMLAKFAGSMAAGSGFLKLAGDISKVNVELDNTARLHGEKYQTLKKWEYTASELGGNAQKMTASIERIKSGITMLDISGDESMLRFLNAFDVPFKDDKTGKALPVTDILLNLAREFQNRNIEDVNQFAQAHGLEGLVVPFLTNSLSEIHATLKRQDDKFVASDEDIASMREFGKNMATIKNHFDSLNTMFVSDMMPTLLKLQDIVKGFFEYLQENPEQARIAGMIGAGVGIAGTGYVGTKIFGKIFGSKGAPGGILTDHVQKVFVVNMGQGGFNSKGLPAKSTPATMPMYASLLGSAGIAVVAGYADHSPKSEVQKKRFEEEESPYIQDFISKYGVEGVREAYKAQGPAGWHSDSSWQSADPTFLVKYLKQYEDILEIGREYGEDFVSEIYSKNKGFFSSNDWRSASPDDLRKWIQGESSRDVIPAPVDQGSPTSENKPESSLAVGGIGGLANRELRDGNQLKRESNSLLKQIYTNPTLKNIEDILERVFPKDANKVDLEWGGSIIQPGNAGALLYSGKSNVRGEDGDLRSRQDFGIDYFMSKGFTRDQAIGLIANFTRESALLPHALNPNERSGNQRFSSKGIAQWNRDRLDNFAREMGKPIEESTLQEQLAFALWELENTHKKAGDKLKKASSADEATRIITQHYEIPANMDEEVRKRQGIARDLVGTGFDPYQMMVNQLQTPTRQQAVAGNTSTVDVTIGNVTVQTTAQTLSGVGEDMAEAVKARMMLGQLTTGAV